MKINTAGPPSKPGTGAANKIGSLRDQIQRIGQPRPTPPTVTPSARRVSALEGRIAELERLVSLLLLRTTRGAT